MATKPNFRTAKASPSEEPDSDAYDPNRFTVTRMPTEFLRWMLKNPLPREKKEDLWKDTLPPGMDPPPQAAPKDDEPALVMRRTGATPHVVPLASNSEVQAPPANRKKALVALLILGTLIGCLFLFWDTGNAPPEPTTSVSAATGPAIPPEEVGTPSASAAITRPESAPEKQPQPELTTTRRVEHKPTKPQAPLPAPKPSTVKKPAPSPSPEPVPSHPAPQTTTGDELELIVGQ